VETKPKGDRRTAAATCEAVQPKGDRRTAAAFCEAGQPNDDRIIAAAICEAGQPKGDRRTAAAVCEAVQERVRGEQLLPKRPESNCCYLLGSSIQGHKRTVSATYVGSSQGLQVKSCCCL
jgi:hypothetical protein